MAQNDESAFEEIFYHYLPRIEPFVYKMTRSAEVTEEIIHDIFLALWLNKEKSADINNLEAYLFTAATNRTFTYLKRTARQKKEAANINVPDKENAIEEFINFKESAKLINLAVEQLPPKRKAIFKLCREEGLSHNEISEHLHIARSTVKNQLMKALKFINEYLQNSSLLPILLLLLIRF